MVWLSDGGKKCEDMITAFDRETSAETRSISDTCFLYVQAQLSQRDRATLLVIEYFAKLFKISQGHSKRHC